MAPLKCRVNDVPIESAARLLTRCQFVLILSAANKNLLHVQPPSRKYDKRNQPLPGVDVDGARTPSQDRYTSFRDSLSTPELP